MLFWLDRTNKHCRITLSRDVLVLCQFLKRLCTVGTRLMDTVYKSSRYTYNNACLPCHRRFLHARLTLDSPTAKTTESEILHDWGSDTSVFPSRKNRRALIGDLIFQKFGPFRKSKGSGRIEGARFRAFSAKSLRQAYSHKFSLLFPVLRWRFVTRTWDIRDKRAHERLTL